MDARIGDERAGSFSVRGSGSRRQDNAPALPSTEINCTEGGVLQRFVFRDIDGNTRAIEAVCAEHTAQHYKPPQVAADRTTADPSRTQRENYQNQIHHLGG